jgi:3-hydroxyacyl-CoA dehydrogenase
MIRVEAAKLGIGRRTFGDREIVERVIYPLINEGARVLDEGVAQRPGDIDIAYVYGYGFPAHRGGPMFYASTVGLDKVYAKICNFAATLDPDDWEPAPLLQRLAEAGKGF